MRALSVIVCLMALVLLASPLCAAGRYPHNWAWSETEQRQIHALTQKVRKTPDGYWQHDSKGVRIRSNVSPGLVAEAGYYMARLFPVLPKAVELPVASLRTPFVITLHRTQAEFAAAATGAAPDQGHGELRQKEGGPLIGEVHLLASQSESGATSLDAAIDLGLLQYQVARLGLKGLSQKQPMPPFLREGCASYFETYDIRFTRPQTDKALPPHQARSAFRQAIKKAMWKDDSLCPNLFDSLHMSENEFKSDPALNGALADNFVDHLLKTPAGRATLKKLHARALRPPADDDEAPRQLMTPTEAEDLETPWHSHICDAAAHTMYVSHSDVAVTGDAPRPASVSRLGRYGNMPLVSAMPAEKGAMDVAWYDAGAGGIRILRCDAESRKLGEVKPDFIKEAKALLGATRLPTDGSYVVGYSKDNAHDDPAFEYWVSRFDVSGKEIFSTRIFGDKKSDVLHAKGRPGGAGTARIVYNPQSELIAFYLCHTMKWPDGVRHQGGYVGFLRTGGEQLMSGDKHMGDGWYFSHNFDQRLIYSNGFYYTLAHGDAYPRALGFTKWTDKGGKKLVNTTYHTIPGESGDNTTHCQTGGMLAMTDNTHPVIFATSNGRDSHDICIKLLNGAGAIQKERWLTTYPQGQYGAFPRIAHYGKDILVAWEETGGQRGGTTLQLMLLDPSFKTLVGRTAVEDLHLSPYHDLINLSDGSVAWAVPMGGSEIRICRIDRPNVMKQRLIKVMATRRLRARQRKPRPGVLDSIDDKVVAKLSKLSSEGKLPKVGMRLSIAKGAIQLAKADAAGTLTFVSGRRKASRKYADLTLKDRATLALLLFRQEPENKALCGLAGFYYDCAGEPGQARTCYDKAGKDVAAKFSSYFE